MYSWSKILNNLKIIFVSPRNIFRDPGGSCGCDGPISRAHRDTNKNYSLATGKPGGNFGKCVLFL